MLDISDEKSYVHVMPGKKAPVQVSSQVSPNEKKSLSEEVYHEILSRLMDSRLIPGSMLNRRDLAKELGVSVAPALEAMLQLEIEEFLETIPRKGTFVKPIRREDIYGQFMVREALECQAARLYCGKPVQENNTILIEAAEKLDSHIGQYNTKPWEEEIQFHLTLLDLANCPPLSQAFKRTMQLGLFYQLNQMIKQAGPENRHVELVQRLSTASPDEAERLIRKHNRSGKDHILDFPGRKK